MSEISIAPEDVEKLAARADRLLGEGNQFALMLRALSKAYQQALSIAGEGVHAERAARRRRGADKRDLPMGAPVTPHRDAVKTARQRLKDLASKQR